MRLIKLTEKPEDEPLLYEAYYNYLGHFTLISSTTVDKMILKALSFPSPNLDSAIQIFENHNYLGYFPHYNVTAQLLKSATADEKAFHKLLEVLIANPLIKFDANITEWLLAQIADPTTINTTLSLIVKLLAQRDHYHLLTGITRRELLRRFVQAIEARLDAKTFKVFRRSDSLRHWCTEILASEQLDEHLHYKVAVLSVAGKHETLFGDNLVLLKDDSKVLRCLLYL